MKDAYYFSHDSNARNDQRLIKLRRKYGAEGVGIYWMIIEILREQEDYSLGMDDDSIENIAYDIRVDQDKLEDIILHFDLFQKDSDGSSNYFYSKSLKRRMAHLDDIKQKRSYAGQMSGKARQKINKSSSDDKQVLNSKVNKVKKVKKVNISFEQFWNLYNYKVGDKSKVMAKWESLSDTNRLSVMEHLPLYIQSTPDKQFRKHPSTYLNYSGWEDEILNKSTGVDKFKLDSTGAPMAYCEKCGIAESYRQEELNGDSRCCSSKLLSEKPKLDKGLGAKEAQVGSRAGT